MRTLTLALIALLWLAPRAQAQSVGFALDRFQPAPTTEDGLALVLPRTLGHLRPSFSVTLDYAHKPLVLTRPNARAESALSEHRLLGHFVAALGLGPRFELFVRAPVLLFQQGDAPGLGRRAEGLPSGGAFGTLQLGATLRLAGEDDGLLSLGLAGWLEAKTGDEARLTGDPGFGVGGLVTAAAHARSVSFSINLGGRYRPDSDFEGASIGPELLLGAGAYAYAGPYVTFLAELTGAVQLRDWGEVDTTSAPLETLLGLRLATPVDLVITAGAGIGLTSSVGVPDARALLQFAYPSPRHPLPPGDEDQDGVTDDRDLCIEVREDRDDFQDDDGCPEDDNDEDGIPDARDKCPNDAEDRDGIEDDDGCPDLDDDHDEVPDGRDQCPKEPEDRDSWADGDGCVDLDNDKDGLVDLKDTCSNEAEDKDGFADEDGCPEPDNDKDGLLDADDSCPILPGPQKDRGCPSAVRIDQRQIRILQRIEFQTRKAEIRPESLDIIDQVRSALEVNPQIRRIRIEGHTDSRGANKGNLKLSQRRAESVMKYLIRAGLDPARLEAKGWGEERPLVKNDSEQNMQTNRRVEFHIVDPSPESGSYGGAQ